MSLRGFCLEFNDSNQVQIKRAPLLGSPFFNYALGVLVTQLTVVSKENQQVSCTNDSVFVEIFSTSVIGVADDLWILRPIEAQDCEEVVGSNCVVTSYITRAFSECHLLKTLGQEDVSIPNGCSEYLADASIDFSKYVSNCVNFSRVVTRGDRLTVHCYLGRCVLGDHRETPEQEQDVKELFHNVLVKGLKLISFGKLRQ